MKSLRTLFIGIAILAAGIPCAVASEAAEMPQLTPDDTYRIGPPKPRTSTVLISIGKDMIDVFKLPVGIVGCTAGAPFGFFDDGVQWTAQGAVAPLKFCWHVLTLPVRFAGIDVI